jgi:phage terminase large subunit-like protein
MKKKTKRGRPRRPNEELELEGYRRIGKKIRKSRIYPPLKIPTFKLESECIIYFFKNFLRHTMAEWGGQPFELLPWEVDFTRAVFDTKGEDGFRQYKKALLLIGRKNGKTVLASGLLLYWLVVKSEEIPNLRIYSAGATKDQAALIFDAASQMIETSPELKKRIKSIPRYKRLINHKTGARYEALSSEVASQYGFFNSSFIIFDEMWLQKSIDFVSALMKSQGNLKEPLFLMLSTSGSDRESPLYDYYVYGQQMQKGIFEDKSFYFKCFELDEGDNWADEKNWHKANPSMKFGVRKIEEMRDQLKLALRIPREETEFRQFYCNEWVSRAEGWVTMQDWDKCFDPTFDFKTLEGKDCFVGIDLSKSKDVTAMVLGFDFNGLFYIIPYFWLPEANIMDRAQVEKIPFDIWARQGHLFLTPGNVIDYEFILQKIEELSRIYNFAVIGIDPAQSNLITVRLQDTYRDRYQLVTQSYKELAAPTMEAERLIVGHLLRHNGNPCMKWQIDNCSTSRDSTGNVKIDRRSRNAKVDGVSAMIDALWVKLKNPVLGSVYEDRGILRAGDSWPAQPSESDDPPCPQCGKERLQLQLKDGSWWCPECGFEKFLERG